MKVTLVPSRTINQSVQTFQVVELHLLRDFLKVFLFQEHSYKFVHYFKPKCESF
jgi:hypothetical protein